MAVSSISTDRKGTEVVLQQILQSQHMVISHVLHLPLPHPHFFNISIVPRPTSTRECQIHVALLSLESRVYSN